MTRLSAHDGHDTRAVGPAPFGSDTVFTFFSPVRHRSTTSFRTSIAMPTAKPNFQQLKV